MSERRGSIYVDLMETSVEAGRTKRLLWALVGLVLLACAASSSIEARGGGAYAPVNERNGGSLRYYEGTKSREDAYREMYTYCRGGYEITNERDVNRGSNTTYNGYGSTVTSMIEHIIDFRCVGTPGGTNQAVRLSGDEWRLARDEVARRANCPSANVEHEVGSPTAGAKGYAVSACGQRWLCSAGNGMAACSVDGAQPLTSAPANGLPPPPPPPPVDLTQVPTL